MQRTTLTALFLLTLTSSAHAIDHVSEQEPVASSELTEIVGEASTRYRTRGAQRARAINVELAAKLLHGTVLAPGEELSFDARVGERTAARGFRVAPVIANGQLSRGVGGGVCQVAGTLHLAALRAGLEVTEHRTHTLPSTYLDPGLDARIAWGTQDYRARNPHDFPVRVRAIAADGQLSITFEGAEARGFEVRTEVVRVLVAEEQVVTDPQLAAGEHVVEREGREGVVVRVVRSDAEGRRTVTLHRYAAAPRIVRAGA